MSGICECCGGDNQDRTNIPHTDVYSQYCEICRTEYIHNTRYVRDLARDKIANAQITLEWSFTYRKLVITDIEAGKCLQIANTVLALVAADNKLSRRGFKLISKLSRVYKYNYNNYAICIDFALKRESHVPFWCDLRLLFFG
ncbi:hypothetical protein F-M6_0249 [Faustovirus]|nr:hypothetical protein F-M6_0249 [Faustovirus]